MSIKLNGKIDDLCKDIDFPDKVEELNELRDSLYEQMSLLAGKISDDSTNLTEFYQANIKQKRASYIKDDGKVYKQAKKVDNLVNEYNNARILIELIEKKIENNNK